MGFIYDTYHAARRKPRTVRGVAGALVLIAVGSVVIATPGGGGGSSQTANLWIDSNGGTCTRQATRAAYADAAACSSFNAAYTAASAGDLVIVRQGTYTATFTAGTKGSNASRITFRSADGNVAVGNSGARREVVTMGAINVGSTGKNFTIDGVNFARFDSSSGSYSNISLLNSNLSSSGEVTFTACGSSQVNILFDGNVYANQPRSSTTRDGRVTASFGGNGTCGVTLSHSLFTGSSSDGVFIESSYPVNQGIQILYNEFTNMGPIGDSHTDAIQCYAECGAVIVGNYMHDLLAQPISCFDGCRHETVTDNVVKTGTDGYPYAISYGSDNASTIEHNTLVTGSCNFNLQCGVLLIDDKSGLPASTGTIIRNNIAAAGVVTAGTPAVNTKNMVQSGASGTNFNGTPVFVGGSNPTTWAGYALAPGSPGKNAGTDGLDVGIRVP